MRRSTQLKRDIVKATNLKSRDISIQESGCSIKVNIKRFVPLGVIEQIASREESIDRCHVTGEILQGANTFVFVRYMSWDIRKNEVFKIEVPNVAIEQIESVLPEYFNNSWASSGIAGRIHHLVRVIKSNCLFFSDWTKDDIHQAINLIEDNSSIVKNWIYWENMSQYESSIKNEYL